MRWSAARAAGVPVSGARPVFHLVLVAQRADAGHEDLAHPALSPDGQPVDAARAWLRYLLAWLWFVPALVALKLFGLRGGGAFAWPSRSACWAPTELPG